MAHSNDNMCYRGNKPTNKLHSRELWGIIKKNQNGTAEQRL